MKVLVFGGRDYDNKKEVDYQLSRLHKSKLGPIDLIITGGCRGADLLGKLWAQYQTPRIPYKEYMADWDTHGKAAGPIRNQQMIDEGKPDFFIAFSGGKGTKDMFDRCMKANIAGVKANR